MENTIAGLQTLPINYYIVFCSILFAIGVIGVLVKRNALVIFMSIELMLNSANLLLAAFSAYRNDPSGQIFVFFIFYISKLKLFCIFYLTTKSSLCIVVKH